MANNSLKRVSASTSPMPTGQVGPEYTKLVDISRCIGCKGCEVACKEWNELGVEPTANFGSYQSHQDLSPDTWTLMRFHETEVDGDLRWMITKAACLHCAEPACLYACPSPGAIVQYSNGIVDIQQDNCIGCQLCVSACPFDIPRFDRQTRKVYKCTMCSDRVGAGLEPACVKTCPTNAISWGSRDDMLALADASVERLKERGFAQPAVYNPSGVGGTHMMYVVPHGDRLSDYFLPENPQARGGSFKSLSWLRSVGAWVFGLGFVGTLLHYMALGPKTPENTAPTPAEERP